MKSILFIAAALCLISAIAQTQQFDRSEAATGTPVFSSASPLRASNDSGGADTEFTWSLGTGYAMNFIRQYDASEDNSIAVLLGAEIPLVDIGESLTAALRPAFLYVAEAALVDVGVSLRYGALPVLFAGIGVDILGESNIQYRHDDDYWNFVLERDAFMKRLFAQIGLRYTHSKLFIELQHRTALKKGIRTYWNPPTNSAGREHPTGYRRQFVVALLLGVTL